MSSTDPNMERPHGIASGCEKCKHACALAVDRSSTYVQCGNPKCYDYGYWTEGWPFLIGLSPEERRCDCFEQNATLVFGPRSSSHQCSPGYETAWIESAKRLEEWYHLVRSGETPENKLPAPTDVHPLGMPEDYWLARSYVRIHNEGESEQQSKSSSSAPLGS